MRGKLRVLLGQTEEPLWHLRGAMLPEYINKKVEYNFWLDLSSKVRDRNSLSQLKVGGNRSQEFSKGKYNRK